MEKEADAEAQAGGEGAARVDEGEGEDGPGGGSPFRPGEHHLVHPERREGEEAGADQSPALADEW